MRILLLNQFYPPDGAPTGQVAHDLARCLVARGHEVSALASSGGYCGQGGYPRRQVLDGVVVERVRTSSFGPKSHLRKLLSYASFYLVTAFRLALLSPRPEVVVALTTPPYIGLLARLVGWCRGWRRVHWVMDLYPDVMVAHGMVGRGVAGRLALAVLRWLTRRELAGAQAVLTLGPDMAARCGQYVASPGSVAWVPLWAADGLFTGAEEAVRERRRERGWDGRLVLLYSGNMGLGHRFGEFLAAAAARIAERGARSAGQGEACDAAPVVFAFAGGGRRRADVEAFLREHPGAPVELLPYCPAGDLAVHLRSGDVLLASLEPAWAGCMLPSKVQGILAAGRPVIFVGPPECSLAQWVRQADAGWVVPAGDEAALRAAIRAAADPEERRRRGVSAQAFARRHFDREHNCALIAEVLEGGDRRRG